MGDDSVLDSNCGGFKRDLNCDVDLKIEKSGLLLSDPVEVGFCVEKMKGYEQDINKRIEGGQLPGVLSVIARSGKLVYVNAQGFSCVATQKQMLQNTIFRIYSMAKPITVVAVMMLYEEGKFSIDDPISDYLPEFLNMSVYTEHGLNDAESDITIRHLLTHTAGLTYSMLLDVPAVSKIYQKANINEAISRLSGRTLKQYVKKLSELPLISHPGKEWHYCEGMSILARLIEVLSGQTYGEFLSYRIFQPLEMVDTGYFVPIEKLDRLATLYEQCPDKHGFEVTDSYGGDYSKNPPLEPGGSGLVSTMADYLRFTQMLLNNGELDGKRLLNLASVELILRDQFGGDFGNQLPASVLPAFQGLGFGFGGYVVTDIAARGGGGSNGEYGWSGWANTSFWIDPQEKMIGMVFMQMIPQPDTTLNPAELIRQYAYQAISHSEK
jgi:CubicO group peptidase (beta-lactamase class C family)